MLLSLPRASPALGGFNRNTFVLSQELLWLSCSWFRVLTETGFTCSVVNECFVTPLEWVSGSSFTVCPGFVKSLATVHLVLFIKLFHKLGDCFKLVYWLLFKRKKKKHCLYTCIFVSYSKLRFLVIFDLLFSRIGNSCGAVFFRSSELNFY